MEKKRALVVCNRKSGHQKGMKKVNKVKEGLSDIYDVDIYISEYAKSITDYIIKNGEAYDTIVSMGGDGTVNETINGVLMLKKRPKLAFMPLGTCNDVCHTYGYTSIRKTLKKIHENNEREIDAFKINEKYFIYAFAVGSFSNVTYETGGSKKFLGKLFYYIRGGAKFFMKSQIAYELDEYRSDAYLVVAVNSKHLGGFKIRCNQLNDGKIHMYIIDYNKYQNGAFNFGMLMLFGKKSKIIHHIEVEDIYLKLGKEMPFNTDGELLGSYDYINMKVLKKAITIF